jgi:hypothetical protein
MSCDSTEGLTPLPEGSTVSPGPHEYVVWVGGVQYIGKRLILNPDMAVCLMAAPPEPPKHQPKGPVRKRGKGKVERWKR